VGRLRVRGDRGYFLPFAIATVFAVMTVAAAVVLGTASYRLTTGRVQRELVDRVSLESAIAATADDLINGAPQPLAAHDGQPLVINGRTVEVRISAPEGKFDLNGDSRRELADGLAVFGLQARLRDRLLAALPPPPAEGRPAASVDSLASVFEAAAINGAEEDCLRRWVTVGRWPEGRADEAMGPAADEAPTREIRAGDQVDLRASIAGPRGRIRVLWARLRFTGAPDRPWLAHDWRFLTIRADDVSGCPA
jgi:hypothetical protein